MTGSILLGIFIIILVLVAVLVVRTCSRQPTPAMTASVELDKGPRARVHKTCEKHVFNGNLLFKWSGKGKAEPILLMSHQDVVEANGSWEHEPFGGYIDGEGKLWGGAAPWTPRAACTVFSVRWRS